MGAFDGYVRSSPVISQDRVAYEYFETQSAFRFFEGFGINELTQLLEIAITNNSNKVWVPKEGVGNGHIGLGTWYVKALINEHYHREDI